MNQTKTVDIEGDHKQFLHDIVSGLSKKHKIIPSKYLYDTQGARLFERICDLDEYYLTRTELTLLRRHAGEIASRSEGHVCVIEFGSGADKKIRILLEAFNDKVTYIPVDICQHYLDETLKSLSGDFANVTIQPFLGDFTRPLNITLPSSAGLVIGFFSGSTIGNLDVAERLEFMRNAKKTLGLGSYLLLGADLRKSEDVLHKAYNDREGVTAAFNLNLLARANRDLNADFNLRRFKHEGIWNDEAGRMEMHLVSLQQQDVKINDNFFSFTEGESIHTESSHKFTVSELQQMAQKSGWRIHNSWLDDQKLFSLNLLQAMDD